MTHPVVLDIMPLIGHCGVFGNDCAELRDAALRRARRIRLEEAQERVRKALGGRLEAALRPIEAARNPVPRSGSCSGTLPSLRLFVVAGGMQNLRGSGKKAVAQWQDPAREDG